MCDECTTPIKPTTRRQALGLAGAGGVALLFAGGIPKVAGPELAEAASATCVMTPAKTEGPYFVDEKLNRTDIRTDSGGGTAQAGTPLTLTMYVFDADGDCAPVPGAQVDIWHANADGKYSDVSQNGTVGQDWLRGYQVTDSDGKVTFTTIWPGWYSGRAVHIHFKVRTSSSEFTSQMFFTDAMNATVYADEPYASRGTPEVLDSQDNILGGDAATLTLHPTRSGSGYAADFSVGVTGASSGTPGTTTDTTTTGTPTSETADTAVAAAIATAKAVRLAGGRRQVRVRLTAEETVVAVAKVARGGRRLARTKATLEPGTRTVRVAIPANVRPGAARVTLWVADGAGNSRKHHRSVHIPKRRA